jgi:solute carrier family 25 carnitine/acylcarnitine transporter 20/29
MRTWWGAVCAVLPLIAAAQVQLPLNPVPLSTTLVDALSADPAYTSLIRLLQRARLIPTLNRLNKSTFFAPTNDAIERHTARDSLWRAALGSDNDNLPLEDNRHEELRQQLFYHLLNYSLPDLPNDSSVQVHKTLLFPRSPVEPPSRDPPPLPPWMPVPGGTLGGEPQRLRASSQDGGIWVGVNAFGEDGAQVVKKRVDTDNGILLGISSVLDTPSDLGAFNPGLPVPSKLTHL